MTGPVENRRSWAIAAAFAIAIVLAGVPRPVEAQSSVPVRGTDTVSQPGSVTGLPPALPLRRDAPEDPWHAVLPLAIVAAGLAAVAAYVVMRRRGLLAGGMPGWPGRAGALLRRVASLPLSQQASVHLVRWGDEEYLLGATPQGIAVLGKRVLPAQAPGEGDSA